MTSAAAGEGIDVIGVLGLMLAIGLPFMGLLIFAIKALIYKTVSPIQVKQNQQDSQMQLLEKEMQSVKETNAEIIKELKRLPDLILAGLKEREEIYDLKYVTKK
jgi:hypothetical protein